MIRAIGLKRVMLILILIGAAAAMAFYNYSLAIPKKEQAKRELSSVRSSIDTLKTELENMQNNMHIFEARRILFKEMQDEEFFSKQDRVEARDRMDAIQKISKILRANYEVAPADVEEADVPEAFEYSVIKSDVKIATTAVDDTDIYRFIYYLNYGFPGHVTIKHLNIERKMPIDENLLKDIGRGAMAPIIEASMDLEWRTMARKSEVEIAPKIEGRGDLQ